MIKKIVFVLDQTANVEFFLCLKNYLLDIPLFLSIFLICEAIINKQTK